VIVKNLKIGGILGRGFICILRVVWGVLTLCAGSKNNKHTRERHNPHTTTIMPSIGVNYSEIFRPLIAL
jgi:hypothetical protein